MFVPNKGIRKWKEMDKKGGLMCVGTSDKMSGLFPTHISSI